MDHFTTLQLLALGMTEKRIRSAVHHGELIRARRGHFARPGADPASLVAVRAGGAVACVSELRHRGVWVLDLEVIHVRVPRNSSRLSRTGESVHRHWDSHEPCDREGVHVSLISALVQAFGCLDHRAWIASVDSAVHIGALHPHQLGELRARLPAAASQLLRLVDGSAESGLETIVRVIARELGFRVRTQVRVEGVGRVDLVIEEWIVVETDGTAFHDQALSAKDRQRDARLVERGRTVLRPGYSLIVFDQSAVARQLIGAVSTHRKVANSGTKAARARSRLARLGFS